MADPVIYDGMTAKEWVEAALVNPDVIQQAKKIAYREIRERPRNTWYSSEQNNEQALFSGMRQQWPMLYTFRQAGYSHMELFADFFFDFNDLPAPACHKEVYDRYKGGYGDELMCVIFPREHGKTTGIVKIFAWHGACYFNYYGWRRKDPKRMIGHPFVIIASAGSRLSKGILAHLKEEFEQNELLNAAFAPPWYDTLKVTKGRDNPWNEDNIILSNRCRVFASGMSSQVRGELHGPFRPTLILIDDAEGERDINTLDTIKKNRDVFENAIMFSRQRTGKYRGRVVVVGSVVHEQCLVNHIRKVDDRFKTIYRKALTRGADGKQRALWPENKSVEMLLQEKEAARKVGKLRNWMQENQNEAMTKTDRPFPLEKNRYWEGDFDFNRSSAQRYIKVRRTYDYENNEIGRDMIVPVNVYFGIDLGRDDKRSSDYNVIMAIGISALSDIFILDYWRKQTGLMSDVITQLFDMVKKYHPKLVTVETIGHQKTTYHAIKNEMRLKNFFFSLQTQNMGSIDSKVVKVSETLEPRWHNGAVYLRPGMYEFEEEQKDFPQAEHDDLLDGLWLSVVNSRPCSARSLHSTGESSYVTDGPDRRRRQAEPFRKTNPLLRA